MALCLVVDDEPNLRTLLASTLRAEGYEVVAADTGAAALRLCHDNLPEVVLLDLGLPDVDGLRLIPQLLEASPLSRIIVLTGRNSVSAAVDALRAGARHYLVKPWDRDELLLVIAREVRTVDADESQRRSAAGGVFWGGEPAMVHLRAQLEKVARASLTPVLIFGETGNGKEVVARELHDASRATGPFIALNCAAVPSELLESELFGHERGAFTGAETRRRGMVELARDGTLFLDEIGEMPLALQPKLLRFLQDHRFRRVGGEQELVSPSRVMGATHKDLEAMVAEGRFRADLFFRLAVVRLDIPPLRERRRDLLPLAYFLIGRKARALGRSPKQLEPAAERAILEHIWPGNVRELINRLERALVLGEGPQISVEDLDLARAPEAGAEITEDAKEVGQLRQVLEQHGWNIARAARRLGVERHWLRYRMAKLKLVRPDRRKQN